MRVDEDDELRWPTPQAQAGLGVVVGAVLLARLVGSGVAAALLTVAAAHVNGLPLGLGIYVSGASVMTTGGVVAVAVICVLEAAALRPALRLLGALEISFTGALVAFAIGNFGLAAALYLLERGTATSGALPIAGALGLPLSLAALAVEVALVQGSAGPPSARRPAAGGETSVVVPALVAAAVAVVIVLAVSHRIHLGGNAHTSPADARAVEAQMSRMIHELDRGLRTPKTLEAISCAPAHGQPAGFGRDPVYSYFSCDATYTSGRHQGWCAAYDGRAVGTYYEGPEGCAGPKSPEIEP